MRVAWQDMSPVEKLDAVAAQGEGKTMRAIADAVGAPSANAVIGVRARLREQAERRGEVPPHACCSKVSGPKPEKPVVERRAPPKMKAAKTPRPPSRSEKIAKLEPGEVLPHRASEGAPLEGVLAPSRKLKGQKPVRYLDAEAHHCAWPLWDGQVKLEDKMVCGAAVDRDAGPSVCRYCEAHGALATNQRTKKRVRRKTSRKLIGVFNG